MNPLRPQPPSDDEIDRLFARRIQDTTPEFERRWVDLKRALRQAPPRPRAPAWSLWLGGVTAGAALLVALLVLTPDRRPPPIAEAPSPALVELFALDAVLIRATPLLDAESRAELLHLPVPTPRQS
ncbi:MAG: hypothetical protein HZA31_11635 [Opitutae bacterium]|nr:hypothetical protein [Opitutae bacterium]